VKVNPPGVKCRKIQNAENTAPTHHLHQQKFSMYFFAENYSKSGEIVLDLFGGSGTTLIACEQLGRKCRMMELDPKYCDVIIKRWEEFTGKKAVKISGEL
jgi:DNA modification methylase